MDMDGQVVGLKMSYVDSVVFVFDLSVLSKVRSADSGYFSIVKIIHLFHWLHDKLI